MSCGVQAAVVSKVRVRTRRPRLRRGCLVLTLSLLTTAGCAPRDTGPDQALEPCAEVSLRCGAAPSVAFDHDGRLWAAFEQERHVYVTSSDDLGASFTAPVPVNPEAETIETNGENRPKIAIDRGTLYVSWTKKLEGGFNGEIRFSRSLDGGATFEAVRTLNDDGLVTGHRFDSLHVDAAGHVYVAWVDKRDLEAARSRGEEYRGAAIYYTVSTDRGATFAANRRVADHACECCRIAIADGDGRGAAIFWRHVFEGEIRDHAFAGLGAEGVTREAARATRDGWHLEGCPHHGPAAVPADESSYHLTWFTAAEDRPAVWYGRLDATSGEMRLGKVVAEGAAVHPHVARAGERLALVWKEHGGDSTTVFMRTSDDEGVSWSERRALASTAGPSDHPFLVSRGADAFLSWHTVEEGLRIVRAVGS